MLFVSPGGSRPPRRHDGSTPPSFLPPPDRTKIPMMLLLQQRHFARLLSLLQQLSAFECGQDLCLDSQEKMSVKSKARVLSRKVWELLMLLPTNPDMLEAFRSIGHGQVSLLMLFFINYYYNM